MTPSAMCAPPASAPLFPTFKTCSFCPLLDRLQQHAPSALTVHVALSAGSRVCSFVAKRRKFGWLRLALRAAAALCEIYILAWASCIYCMGHQVMRRWWRVLAWQNVLNHIDAMPQYAMAILISGSSVSCCLIVSVLVWSVSYIIRQRTRPRRHVPGLIRLSVRLPCSDDDLHRWCCAELSQIKAFWRRAIWWWSFRTSSSTMI